MEPLTHNAASVSVEQLPNNNPKPPRHPNDVEFIVKYPEGYSGPKIMPEGNVIISKEAAEKFTSLGIGSVAGSDEKPQEVTAPDPEIKNYDKLNKEQLTAELILRNMEIPEGAKKADLVSLLLENDSASEGAAG